MEWLSSRMRERSTWAGLMALLSLMLGKAYPETISVAVADAGMAIGAALAVISRERAS